MATLRRLWGCYTTCAVLVFTAQLLTVLLITSVVLGTGFVQLPVITDRLAPQAKLPSSTPAVPAPPSLLEGKWEVAQGTLPLVRIELTQEEVAQLIAEISGREPAPLRNMRPELRPGQVRVKGLLPGPLPVEAQIWGHVEIRLGRLGFAVEQAFVRDIAIPRIVAEPFAAWATEQIRRPTTEKKIPLTVDQVETLDGRIIFRGRLPDTWRPER